MPGLDAIVRNSSVVHTFEAWYQRLGMNVDANRFSPAPKEKELLKSVNIEPSEFVFLYMGRLAPEKGLPALFEAFKRLDGPGLRLLVIGSGPERPHLIPGPRITLLPAVPYDMVHRWHRAADAFVYPSRSTGSAEEQFGYSLVEAMSSGKPVIATKVGGMPDVVGDAGILVEEGKVEPLAQALEIVASDASLRQNDDVELPGGFEIRHVGAHEAAGRWHSRAGLL